MFLKPFLLLPSTKQYLVQQIQTSTLALLIPCAKLRIKNSRSRNSNCPFKMLVRTLEFLCWDRTKLSKSVTSISISKDSEVNLPSKVLTEEYDLTLLSTNNHKCYTLLFSIPGIFIIFINLNLCQYIWTVVITSYSDHWRMCSRARNKK